MKKKFLSHLKNRGMTYIELIVVLSIFSILSAVSMYNYGIFQKKVDITNLANDVALKAVQAQKDAINGKVPPNSFFFNPANWQPSYGLYLYTKYVGDGSGLVINDPRTSFIYFADLDNNKVGNLLLYSFFGKVCSMECQEIINITKGNYISGVHAFFSNPSLPDQDLVGEISLTYTRPDSGLTAYFNGNPLTSLDRIEIYVSSPGNGSGTISRVIKLYASGRIQID